MIKIMREKYKKNLAFKILVVTIVVFLSTAIMLPIVKLAEFFGVNVKGNTGLNFDPSLGPIFFFFLFGICSILIIWLAQKYIHKKPFSQLGFRSKFGRDLFFGFIIGMTIVTTINTIYGLNCTTIEFNPITIPKGVSVISYIVYYSYFLLGFIAWNSFIEELGARAYPIEKLKNDINPHIIFIIMGLIFSFVHFIARDFDIHYFIGLMGFSYIFSLLYYYSRSIWLVVGVHSGVNWINFSFFGTNNWKLGGLYNVKISGVTSWILDYAGIFIYLIILVLIVILNKKGFFKKHFPETIKSEK